MNLDGKSFACGLLTGVLLALFIALVLALAGAALFWVVDREVTVVTPASSSMETIPAEGDASVIELLKPILREHDMPGMAAAIVTSAGLQRVGAAGLRKRGEAVPVTLDDHWHLGSNAKAMTATLIARLVERGELGWDTTMADVFPELAAKFHSEMRAVTVEQLLSHRSGLPANLSLRRYRGDDVRQQRECAVVEYLGREPIHPPGSQYAYSNLGYIIAGAVVEAVLDKTWEEAIRDELFNPLSMASAGFGGTGTPGNIDQPWPHADNGKPKSRNGPSMDNPPVMGPAGRVHCTIQDWAKFVQDQLRGAREEDGTLLKQESYTKLHTPLPESNYALGWGVTERGWGGGTVLRHNGDNTMNHANVWIAPRRDFALLVGVNQGGDEAFEATDDAVSALIDLVEELNLASPNMSAASETPAAADE